MAIQDDFTINPDTKVIRHDTTKSTVYSAVAFYSFLQDAFDEPGFLSYEIPVRFNTPTSFTMLNGWFLDDGDGSNLLQFLTGGGIDTLNYSTISDPVLMIDLDYATFSFNLADLDNTVTADGVDIGPLLSFKDDYPDASTARIWVRDTGAVNNTVPGQNINVTDGFGDYTTTGYSQSGDNIYHNLFTIAAFPGTPNPQVYVYQNHPVDGTRTRISEWSAFTNWGSGAAASRGSIDILITTQLGGSLIDGGNISTFVRQTADTFTFVESTLTTSGRTPIATETSTDTVNITEGEHYLLYDDRHYEFVVGDVITNVPIGVIDLDITPPSWYAEVVSTVEFANSNNGLLVLRGLRGSITDRSAIFVGSDQNATANGIPGDTLIIWESEAAAPVAGDIGKIATGTTGTPKRLLAGFDLVEKYAIMRDDSTVTGAARDFYYVDFSADEAFGTTGDTGTMDVTASSTPAGAGTTTSNTLVSGFNDITVAHMNGTIVVNNFLVASFIEGERVTWSGGEAIMVQTDGSTSMMLGNVTAETDLDVNATTITGDVSLGTCDTNGTGGMTDDNTQNFEFSLQTTGALYSVFIEGGSIYNTGRSLTDIYAYLQYYLRDGQSVADRIIYTSDGSAITQLAAEEYIKADTDYNATKAAPYGTLAGGVFFGAQAVWIEGMATSDNNNINLTDSTGTLRSPFTSIDVVVTNTRADDRVAIFLDDPLSSGLPDKDTYTSDGANNTLNGTTFERDSGAFPNDTPTAGAFIAVDNALNKQHRYRFASRNGTTDPGTFTLPSGIPTELTADGNTSGQRLQDAGEDWSGPLIQVGDIIHRTSGSLGFAYVTSINDLATGDVQTTLIEDTSGTAATGWSSGDTFRVHTLVKLYTASDTFFVPYMDEIEDTGDDTTTGTITVTLTYVSDRNIILEVRNVEAATEIIPFKTTGSITVTGYTQGVIRNEDTVFTP